MTWLYLLAAIALFAAPLASGARNRAMAASR